MRNRRAFIDCVAGGLLASVSTTFAQQPTRIPRIGILANTEGSAWNGFRLGLRELGYVDGRNVSIEWRWADGKPDRYLDLANELVQSKVDVIVTSSTQATRAAKQATSAIAIVMLNSTYPDKIGLVESLARPGGNITGFSNVSIELTGKRLELLKEIAPQASRVAFLWNPASPTEVIGLRDTQRAAAAVGLTIQPIAVQTSDDYHAAFSMVTTNRADALHAVGNPVNFKSFQLIVDFALKSRLPSSFEERGFVEAGGLFSYAPSFTDTYRRGATYVDKILRGARAGDLPIQQPTKVELVINAKTANALGLKISRALRVSADEIIQ